ncbi:MAG: ATP-binding protein [Cyanobacteria bacterium P01_F01_bin.150]
MSSNRHRLRYQQIPLPLKISLPFILMFLGFWLLGSTVLGQYFAYQLELKKQKRATNLVTLVDHELQEQLDNLRRSARLLAAKDTIVEETTEQNQQNLLKTLLPLKSIVKTDILSITNINNQPLVDFRKSVLQGSDLEDTMLIELALTGADISTFTTTQELGLPVLVGTAPIKNDRGIVGGLLLGIVLNNALLTEINANIQEQLLVVSGDNIVASTFAPESIPDQWSLVTNDNGEALIQGQIYLAKTISLNSLNDSQFNLVLLISKKPLEQAKRTMWLFIFTTASLGATLTTVIGYWLAQRITRPIRNITVTAQQVIEDNNFQLRTSANTQDEIGQLATALNQLIQWVGQYTHELELAGQTLETQVEHRTEELQSALKELQDTQAQLIHTEKMSSLGEMMAGIAHEINNPISFVHGNIVPLNEYCQDLLELIKTYQKDYPDPTKRVTEKQEDIDLDFLIQDLPCLLDSIKTGTDRVRQIVVSMRNFSRLDEAAIKDVNIHDGINSTLLLLNHRLKHNVEVIKNYGDIPQINCSPAQLNQVFTNIISNALDAMFEANSLEKKIFISTSISANNHIKISIRDTGPGIVPNVRAKIFDPFFTTKPVGKGTGLGLGICFRIVQQHQGNIEVNSKVNQGTEFVVTLPVNMACSVASEATPDADQEYQPQGAIAP